MEKEVKKNNKKSVFKEYFRWPLIVLLISLMLSFVFCFFSELVLSGANLIIAVLVIVAFLIVSVVSDIIGVAVTAADEGPFRSMASRKIKGAKEGIILINNADKVASIFADIIGDICGILSGAAGAAVTAKLISGANGDLMAIVIASIVSALIAGVIIFGKAMGKRMAIDKCDTIVLLFGKLVYVVTFGKLSIKNK